MELSKQVVSLELARKLKELGVKQESLFCWNDGKLGTWDEPTRFGNPELYAAFTVAELGEMLPKSLKYKFSDIGHRDADLHTGKILGGGEGWYLQYTDRPNNYVDCAATAPTEADTRAKMLIYLVENELVIL